MHGEARPSKRRHGVTESQSEERRTERVAGPIHALALLLFLAPCDSAAAQAENHENRNGPPSTVELEAAAETLGSEDPSAREEAYRLLTTLGRDALPSITHRVKALKSDRPDPDEAHEIMRAFEEAAGARTGGVAEMAGRVFEVLERRRDPAAIRMAEPFFLLRSLERIGSHEAGLLIPHFVILDRGAWLRECERSRDRLGVSLLPVLILSRGNSHPAVRRWARQGIDILGMKNPSAAAALPDPHLVAQVLRAYATPPDFEALPVITSFLGSDRGGVRQAARFAMARFGRNGIWQLREAYRDATGRDADRSWGWKRISEELYTEFDRPVAEEAERLLESGLAAYLDGDLDAMQRYFDRALVVQPDLARRSEMAPGYAELGRARLRTDDLQGAESAYRRALRLAPDAERSEKWSAQLAFVAAERRLSRAVVDLDGYRSALERDPGHRGAAQALDRLGGSWEARRRDTAHWARIGALVLLVLLAFGLLYWRQRPDIADMGGS